MSEQSAGFADYQERFPDLSDSELVKAYRNNTGEVVGQDVMRRVLKKTGIDPAAADAPLLRGDGSKVVVDDVTLTNIDYLDIASDHVDPRTGMSADKYVVAYAGMHESDPRYAALQRVMIAQLSGEARQ